jgi:pyruvate/2-oxoglutarate dehydrogenase complex dihydrolipoamide acyltransferase (E2) component
VRWKTGKRDPEEKKMEKILMPSLGQTVDEIYIQEWLVNLGDRVELGQPLCVVETDKAQLEVESAVEGTIVKIFEEAGATVEAGAVIAEIE